MPGTKQGTPPRAKTSNNNTRLIESIRHGLTIEAMNDIQLRGLLQQAHIANKAGPAAFAEWEQAFASAIPEYNAVLAGMIGSDAKSMQAHASGEATTE